MKVWWSESPAPGNFGDVLTPHILNHFRIKFNKTSRDQADTLCIGSIAKHASPNMTMIGTGAMRRSDKIHPQANWLFARGPHTRNIILRDGGSCPDFYGDLGLLLPFLVGRPPSSNRLGIVPHYVDFEETRRKYPNHKVINVLNQNPLDVAREIASCEKIISSSLHGIIAAHAYGIPAAWVQLSDKLAGDGVKFEDHYAAVGLQPIKSTIESPVYQFGIFNTENILEAICSL
jgi:hypothetical protein